MKKKFDAIMYIGLAVIIVEVMALTGIHITSRAAARMEDAIEITEAPPIEVSGKTDKPPVYAAITVSEDDAFGR